MRDDAPLTTQTAPGSFLWEAAAPAVFVILWSSGFVEVLPAKYSDHAGLHLPDGPLPPQPEMEMSAAIAAAIVA